VFVRLLLQTEVGCQRVTVTDIFTKFIEVNLQLQGNDVNQFPPYCPSLLLFKRNRARREL